MSERQQRCVTVALLRKMPRSVGVLTYAVPDGFESPARGTWVTVPFRSRTLRAVIWETSDVTPPQGKTLLPYAANLALPPLTKEQLGLVAWLADTYGVSVSHALALLVPEQPRRSEAGETALARPTPVRIAIERKRAEELRGLAVLGSTRAPTVFTAGSLPDHAVLLSALLARLSASHQALVVVPSRAMLLWIAGALQTGGRTIVVLDPDLPLTAYWRAWNAVRAGRGSVVVTTRKGCGAPFTKLGLVAVLQWNDRALHHAERNPRADGRALVRTLSDLHQAPLAIFDAAVPFGLDENATVVRCAPRARQRAAFSLRDDRAAGNRAPLTDAAIEALEASAGPALVFLNKRGATRQLQCSDCGWVLRCPDDAVPLVEHAPSAFCCHLCGREEREPAACPSCRNTKLTRRGKGTQSLERFLRERFPGRTVVRVDADASMPDSPVDIIVATERIFSLRPREPFRLCVVANVESESDRPSYAAVEQAYALFERLTGLCTLDGSLVLQSWRPDAPLVQALVKHDESVLYGSERSMRTLLRLPPVATICRVFFVAQDERGARSAAESVEDVLRAATESSPWSVEGPYFRARRGRRNYEASFLLRAFPAPPSHATLPTILRSLPDDWLSELDPTTLFAS